MTLRHDVYASTFRFPEGILRAIGQAMMHSRIRSNVNWSPYYECFTVLPDIYIKYSNKLMLHLNHRGWFDEF